MNCTIRSLYLCVKDMDRAIRFYESFLEQPVTGRMIYSVFDVNGFRLGSSLMKSWEDHTYGSNCLPSLEVDCLDILKKKLEGLPVIFECKRIGNNWVSEFEDSEGNHIELTAPVKEGDKL
ncbi:MAG: VOC family protein [Eisenbergiella sp.]